MDKETFTFTFLSFSITNKRMPFASYWYKPVPEPGPTLSVLSSCACFLAGALPRLFAYSEVFRHYIIIRPSRVMFAGMFVGHSRHEIQTKLAVTKNSTTSINFSGIHPSIDITGSTFAGKFNSVAQLYSTV
jgi:hypothetical protein